jgi:methionyl-tRNA formyltransferase
MRRYLFFAYRQWAVNIFNAVSNLEDEFILITNKNLCTKEFIDTLAPDVIFLYGWSWIVPSEIVNNYICLCLHPSKLPKYRGGSPIQNQMIAGESESAVSIFRMGSGLDDGPIYCQLPLSLGVSLDNVLKSITHLGVLGTKRFIEDHKNNAIIFKEQDHKKATFCKRRSPLDSEIKVEDFLKHDAKYFFDMVRSLQAPYPECYIKCKTGRILLKEIGYEQDI